MAHPLPQEQANQLQACLRLAEDPTQHNHARQTFASLMDTLGENAPTAEMVHLLWSELLSARRSAAFWQKISDMEKGMTEQLAQSHFQLQQNYLRLMQEQ